MKIVGAGSIGNHLSHAARKLSWSVDLCDRDPKALMRTREEIYPQRYGAWDPVISLCDMREAPKGGYDLIAIGTPPDSHIPLALAALEEKPRALLIEKPLCGPTLDGAARLVELAHEANVAVYVGYDHVLGQASRGVVASIENIGRISTIDVEFREHWGGIFAAHPWLAGPWESYLGFSMRGGGASGEHSHAINLWQHFSHAARAGRVVEVQAMLDFVRDKKCEYDRLCIMNLRTETELIGRCVQDVVTQPARKWARLQGEKGSIEWCCGLEPGVDAVISAVAGKGVSEQKITKTRPDDFIEELKHIVDSLSGEPAASPIALTCGLDTMLVIAAAHRSAQTGRTVHIDYSQGYRPEALIVD